MASNQFITEMTAAQQVKMDMFDGLSAIVAAVIDDAVALLVNAKYPRNGWNGAQNLPHDGLPSGMVSEICDIADMDAGNDQYMHRCYRMQVVKGDHMLIRINKIGWENPIGQFTENTILLNHGRHGLSYGFQVLWISGQLFLDSLAGCK